MAAKTYKELFAYVNPLAQAYGAAWSRAIGDVFDTWLDRVKQAVKVRFPLIAPSDALPLLGKERNLDRGPSETDASYAARIQGAWAAWPWAGTPYGILSAFKSAGYPRVVLEQVRGQGLRGNQYQLDVNGNLVITLLPSGSWAPGNPNPTMWSVFELVFDEVTYPVWGGSPPSSSSDEANRIRALIKKWAPAHATCNRIVILTAGGTWGYPQGTWGDGSTWGGTTTYWVP